MTPNGLIHGVQPRERKADGLLKKAWAKTFDGEMTGTETCAQRPRQSYTRRGARRTAIFQAMPVPML